MASWSWSGAAVLFDMDGTLVDSSASVVRVWRWTAERLDLPFAVFAPYLHGIPADQVLARVAASAPAEVRATVVEEMLARQATDTEGVVAVPGAAAALAALPADRWAMVTSADRRLAESRLQAAGLSVPRYLVTAELTSVGKLRGSACRLPPAGWSRTRTPACGRLGRPAAGCRDCAPRILTWLVSTGWWATCPRWSSPVMMLG